ncbi:MAG: XdhC/CoxI family protein [Thermoplasmata archaeon]|nr:XdhC/CoxI family protein [Thermoplasmata archaeon]
MDRRLTKEALRLMEAHVAFVRCTVVQAVGSVPGKVGASMLVRPDGTTLGTIGGAALEEQVKTLARAALDSHRGDLRHFELSTWKPGGIPSLCGGSVDIALEYVPALPNLLIWGGGHVAHALTQLLPTLEYDYSIADDREEWVSRERFPSADERIVVPAAELFDRVEPGRFTHLYLLGYDALKDGEVLRAAVDRFPNYIGLIASQAKRAHLFAKLRGDGVSELALSRVHSPVGLAIGAERPAEIAVSIVAEIVRELHPEKPIRRGVGSRARSETAHASDTAR